MGHSTYHYTLQVRLDQHLLDAEILRKIQVSFKHKFVTKVQALGFKNVSLGGGMVLPFSVLMANPT